MALLTQKLDGIAWPAILKDYSIGWADVTSYMNNTSRACSDTYLATSWKCDVVPEHKKSLVPTLHGQLTPSSVALVLGGNSF